MDFGISGKAICGSDTTGVRLPAIRNVAASSSSSKGNRIHLNDLNVLSSVQLKHPSPLKSRVYADMNDSVDLISPTNQSDIHSLDENEEGINDDSGGGDVRYEAVNNARHSLTPTSHSLTSSRSSDSHTNPQSNPPSKNARPRKPKTMQRAKQWSHDIENLFRFQQAGYRDEEEYKDMHGSPEYWDTTSYVKCLQNKQSCFMYFRQLRECEDKYLNKIKLYQY